jgi:hypothetical protein
MVLPDQKLVFVLCSTLIFYSHWRFSRPKGQQIYSKCEHCKFQNPQVYIQGWMCLNPECAGFWKMRNGGPPGDVLDYTADFLELSPTDSLPDNLPEIFPKPPPIGAWDGITTAYTFSKGWHCLRCGRLSSRRVLL